MLNMQKKIKFSLEMAKKRLSGKELSNLKKLFVDYIEQASQYDTKNAQSYLKNLKELLRSCKIIQIRIINKRI